MTKFNKTLLLGIALLIIVVVAGVGAFALLQKGGTTHDVQVKVSYSGYWTLQAGEATYAPNTISGYGDQTTTVHCDRDSWVVTAKAQKQDDSWNSLTVSIIKMDGTVLGSRSTADPHGQAYVVSNIP